MAEIDDVREQVAVANRILPELGLANGITASLGHASMRLPSDPDKFVVKGRGYKIDALAKMTPGEMLTCNLEGFLVDGPPGTTQPREIKMHSCIYKARPDIQSVVHVHPRYIILMSVLEQGITAMCQEGIGLVREPLPVYPHVKTVWSDEEGTEVADLMGERPAIILMGHGASTAARSLSGAVLNMARLEEQARMSYLAHCAAGPDHPRIPGALIDEMTERTHVYELPHFKDVIGAGNPTFDGLWDYFVDLVEGPLG